MDIELKEIQRIPVSLDHLLLVFNFGITRGMGLLIGKMNYTEAEYSQAMKFVYEKLYKPYCDLTREVLGTKNALSFSPATMEFIIYDKESDQINYEIATEHWEKEYGKKYLKQEG